MSEQAGGQAGAAQMLRTAEERDETEERVGGEREEREERELGSTPQVHQSGAQGGGGVTLWGGKGRRRGGWVQACCAGVRCCFQALLRRC